MTLAEQLKADAAVLRAEAATKIAQAETLEQHALAGAETWAAKEFATVKAELAAVPAEIHAWLLAHV